MDKLSGFYPDLGSSNLPEGTKVKQVGGIQDQVFIVSPDGGNFGRDF